MVECVPLAVTTYFLSVLAEGQCQAGWREYEDRCYLFSTDVKTWLEANRYCLEQNSNLLSIQSFHETVK